MIYPILIRPTSVFVFLSFFMIFPLIAFAQPPGCADLKNGVFIYLVKKDGSKIVATRTTDEQTELYISERRTVVYKVDWITDCCYMLVYSSGFEDAPKATQQLVRKHKFVETITLVTPDYYVAQTTLDKQSNPILSIDTLWIKQYRDVKNKLIINTGVDSLVALKKAARDSVIGNSAMLYIFRPWKLTEWVNSYTLFFDTVPICEMTNKSAYIFRLTKMGPTNLHANIGKKETAISLDVKPREKYYLRCDFPWGLNQSPKLTFVPKEEAEPFFEKIK